MLDVFKSDAFSVIELTEAINKVPFQPKRLGELGLFESRGITTTTVSIEEQHGKLALIPAAARGTMPTVNTKRGRNMRSISVPHLPQNDAVMADEVQGIRAFGEEDAVEAVNDVVNDKLEALRANHEATHEYHRCGAIQGIVLDADGATPLYNIFDLFGITETEVTMDLTGDEDAIKLGVLTVQRHIEDSLGADTYVNIRAICGNDFFDTLITSVAAKAAYNRWQDGQFFREQQRSKKGGFEFCGCTWENYRGKIGSVDFIPSDTCRFVVEGVKGLFKQYNAPAPFIETVNTIGKPFYAKQEPMKFDVGIELHTQSNPLFLCTRPATLVKGIIGSSSSSGA